jgi:PKD repeat protein
MLDNTDCNDTDPAVYPGAPEIPGDGIDQNCDGTDAPLNSEGELISDINGGLAPVTIEFHTVIAAGTPPFFYDYDFGDGTIRANGAKKESHTYQQAGIYAATVTVTDGFGMTYLLQKTINVTDLIQVMQFIYGETLDGLLAGESLTPSEIAVLRTNKNKARAYFKTRPHLVNRINQAMGILVDTVSPFDVDDVTERAGVYQLSEQQAGVLYNAVSKTLNIERAIAESQAATPKTIAQIAEEIYATYYGKTLVKTTLEPITRTLILEFSDGSAISFVTRSVRIVDDYLPNGLFELPTGSRLGIVDAYSLEFVPYPVASHDFTAQLIQLGILPSLGADGRLLARLDPETLLSLGVGWEYLSSLGLSSLTISFDVTGGTNPAAEAYFLLVNYDTGKSQLLPPSVNALGPLTGMLDAIDPGGYGINPDTGVVTLSGLELKPDYLFVDTTGIDYNAISQAGGLIYNTLAFEFTDVNADGILDVIYHSDAPLGYQVLYTIE